MVLDVNWFEIYLNLGLDAKKISIGERKAKNLFMRTIHKNCISYFICQINEGFHPLNLSLCYWLGNVMLWIWIFAKGYSIKSTFFCEPKVHKKEKYIIQLHKIPNVGLCLCILNRLAA